MQVEPSRSGDAAAGAACMLCGATAAPTRLFDKDGWDFTRCQECSLVSISPLPCAESLVADYDTSYEDGSYADFAAADEVREVIARRQLEHVRALAGPGPWLDVGCSTGAFVGEATAAGLDAEGVELSAVAVERMRSRGLTVHHASIDAFEPTRRYAVVTAFDLVEHLPDPRVFLARVPGWLTDQGLLVLTLPNRASAVARLMGRQWFYYSAPFHVHYFTPATIRRLLGSLGYREVTVRRASKPLTLDYAAVQLEHLMPAVAPLGRRLMAVLPALIRRRSIPLALGEMLVTARPPLN